MYWSSDAGCGLGKTKSLSFGMLRLKAAAVPEKWMRKYQENYASEAGYQDGKRAGSY